MVISAIRLVWLATAPSTLQAKGLSPCSSSQGWKWSEITVKSKPARSASMPFRTSFLVGSGQLPPRGLVSGDVRAGIVGPLSGQPVIFERIDGADVLSVRTDAHGHFSATLSPGYYYVDQAIPICPRIGACDRKFFP